MSDPRNYTVGWICAVMVEFVAAQEFLDQAHGQPTIIHPDDENSYALGSIGGHNVVIAILPDAAYGVPSAARAAGNMMMSFPNVRFGLMVGIGGGAPSKKNDIRLGDLVISVPSDGEQGAFEYELKNTVRGRTWEVTKRLDPPPIILSSAVATLRTHFVGNGHRIHQAVEAVLARNPRMRGEFQRPLPDTDRLFKSEVDYDPSRRLDARDLLTRRTRATHENPTIHYGTIASANSLMKMATIRDELIAQKNVLCFEMEAAGLMNSFPSLVIRGICDYSDSHKNDVWQGYAAMVAAAYAIELLNTIAPSMVEAQRTIQEIAAATQDVIIASYTNGEKGKNEEVTSRKIENVDVN
ncbi:hypothetical protein BDV12DRAFT_202330 [Aspergillus spectabilis]